MKEVYFRAVTPLVLNTKNLDELPSIAGKILENTSGKKVFAFKGEMGAGKTTLIKELCHQLGSHDNFSSPTYSIINQYAIDSKPGERIYHIDLYRMNDMEEAISVGIEDCLTGRDYCFIEWYQIIEPLLPERTVRVEIKAVDDRREITIFSD